MAVELGVQGLPGPAAKGLKWLRDVSLRRAAHNVVLGERMRERVLACGVPGKCISVIPNWTDGEAVRPIPPEENALRREWGLGKRFVVGYSGNMGRAHEFDTALDAAALLSAREEIVFLWIGGGAQRHRLEAKVRARGLEGRFLFRPYQPRAHLAESLSAADVHLVTLRPELEGLVVPSKLYGALAAGRPVLFVGDASGEVARVLDEARCGLTVAPGQGQDLAVRITELAADCTLRERLGRWAPRALEGRFDRSIACARWQALIEAVAAEAVAAREG